ncbi:MAG: molybdopterin cofactor-binding domain-containing protein, partial [Pseudomonadota bacterium]
ACMAPAGRALGRRIETLAGLDAAGDPLFRRLQARFHAFGAAQCGICTPGMLVAAAALLRADPRPAPAAIERALAGVLCRCTGYRKIIAAVASAADAPEAEIAPAPTPAAGAAVGAPVRRLDGAAKLSGREAFGDDAPPADALTLKAVRSPHHAARFALGDVAAWAAARPGVAAVLTARDVPGENRFGVIPPFADQPALAEEATRFKGEAVAIVAGAPETMATLDLSDFPVVWSEEPAALTPPEALAEGAAALHPNRPGNVMTEGRVARGDLEAGFARAAAVAEGRYATAFVEHAYIEPEAGWARRVGDRLEIWACTQAPMMNRDEIAGLIGVAPEQVRVRPAAVGGGFGSKLDLSVQSFLAIAAWRLGRPVRMTYTRAESMATTTKRHPSEITARIGADADGRLTAMRFHGDFNTGAYASWGPTVANRVPIHASGPYETPAYLATSRAVHTNCAPAGAFRGFGVPQSAIAQETLFDLLAEKLGIDPLAFRLKNALRDGAPTVCGQRFAQGVGIAACFEALAPAWAEARAAAAAANAAARAAGGRLRRGA